MKVCKRCVAIDTRPGINFDENGVCFPCKIAENHENIDWDQRWREVREIAEWGKKNSNNTAYNCIIPVSGGKDSTAQSLYVRDRLGLKPLLVSCVAPPEHQTEIGAQNLANLVSLGFDTITVTPSPGKWKKLARNAFFQYGNYCKSTEMVLYATAPRVAIAFQIPLIFLGENNALTYGELGGSHGGDANRIKYNNTLSGGDPSDMLEPWMTKGDVLFHYFPTDEEMERGNLRIVYLGYYIKEFNNFTNTEVAVAHGLKLKNNQNPLETGSVYNNDALDDDFQHVNQLLKYLKLGFGKVTDEVCEAIHLGLMDRDEAVELVKRYDGRCADSYIDDFCRYLEISKEEFWKVAEQFRNKTIWRQDKDNNWILDRPF